jgi:Uma2 family endonuclease
VTARRYAATIAELEHAITIYRRHEIGDAGPTPKPPRPACVCACGRRIRVAHRARARPHHLRRLRHTLRTRHTAAARRILEAMAVPQTVPVRRLSFEDVMAMVAAGILRETDRVELEGGVLVEMEPSGGAHGSRVTWLNMHVARSLDDGFVVRVQDTFRIPDGGFFEPDIAVGPPTGEEVPRSADLVIEVAISSRRRDREKAAVHAAAGVAEYWIVDVAHGEVVVHLEPRSTGYRSMLAYGRGERDRTAGAGR